MIQKPFQIAKTFPGLNQQLKELERERERAKSIRDVSERETAFRRIDRNITRVNQALQVEADKFQTKLF